MVTLRIDNSECSISGLSVSQLKEMRGLLSYELPSQPGSYARKVSLVSAKGVFATGLLSHVLDHLNNTSTVFDTKDVRIATNAHHGLFNARWPYHPYPHQIQAMAACCTSIRGTVSAVTGFGKSLTMALLIDSLQLKTLIIVPNVGLRTQLRQSMLEIFGTLDNITIENIDSPKLKNCKDYDLLLIDEAHHVAAKTYRKLNKTAWNGIYRRYFFTATPYRSKDEEQLLFESIAGQVIYEIDYHTAAACGYITPIDAYYLEVPKTKIKGNPKSWPSMYSELVVNNEPRNEMIRQLLASLGEKSTLCLVKEIKHGNNIGGLFASGINENTPWLIRLFNEAKLKVLIGTVGVLGEGIDSRPAEFVIIAGLGKSKPQFMQCVGRAVRNYTGKASAKIIIIKDSSHKWTLNHWKIQMKILEDEYGVIPAKLEI